MQKMVIRILLLYGISILLSVVVFVIVFNNSNKADKTDRIRLRSQRRRHTDMRELWFAIAAIVLIFIFGMLAGIGVGGILTGSGKSDDERIEAAEVTSEQERLEGIKHAFEEGSSALQTLRDYYPDELVLYKDGAYCFVPRDSSLKQNSFDSAKVRKNSDGTYGYVDGDLSVIKGIDVSSHQGEIDWAEVAASNVDFAMIRAVYRGYESGKLLEDKQFRTNIEEAHAKGVKVGAYIFTQAVNKQEVDEEISKLNGLLGTYELDYPVAIDVENLAGSTERIESLSKDELTKLILYYCEKVKESGYTPMLYLNIDSALNMIDLAEFEDVKKWFAVYDTDFYYPYAYQMWQYKETGRISGIDGSVDLNLYFPDL